MVILACVDKHSEECVFCGAVQKYYAADEEGSL
jgi:hypothetical protein